MPKNWVLCGHCQGSGVCKNRLNGFQTILWIIPIPIRTSDSSCIAAAGFDPSKVNTIVRCDVCDGTGYVYLDPNGQKGGINDADREG